MHVEVAGSTSNRAFVRLTFFVARSFIRPSVNFE